MGTKKMLDMVTASGNEAVDVILSDVFPEVVKTYGEVIVSEGVATVAGELVGAVCPRLNNIRLSYKQNRLERNVSIMLQRLVESNRELNERISALESTEEGKSFLHNSSEMLLDNIVDEIQSDKVQYSVNGFVNLLKTENANFDMALMFFKTLSQLNDVDIRVLKTYDWRSQETVEPITPFNSDFDYAQLRYIKEKLVRLGLLKSKNQEMFDKNQVLIVDYLQRSYNDSKRKSPRGIKIPKFNKLRSSDTYLITSLGYSLLQLISEQCDMSDLSVPDNTSEESEE